MSKITNRKHHYFYFYKLYPLISKGNLVLLGRHQALRNQIKLMRNKKL